ncbi:toxin-antitoxin system YwqK family antitoxin [Tunicatimonas pelagia]|uniref:toxin-antitoxin system YwqK family antitoxin n=1 Tax=Tunicatimonas pelagia TaxID=931531 RepID=UPI002666A148|nr:membrane-binding protein [Tunicatimonas pelagia]WKN42756.1 membrane-binding protein [Tunicatimonas pelagia]
MFLVNVLMVSCAEKSKTKTLPISISTGTSVEIPNRTVEKSLLHYKNETSLWTLNDQPYSGYIVSFHQDSTLKEKMGILNGKKQNQATRWYPDGQLKQVANYHEGKLHGEKKMWFLDSSHILIAHLDYHLGKAHGEQKQWYPTGELYKKLNLDMGREEGIQQAFRKNGELYANYEAKNGRIFGLKKAKLCYGLEDENIQYEK